jgi:hypothetical protein
MSPSATTDAELSSGLTVEVAGKHGIPVVVDGALRLVAWDDANDFVYACTKERLAVRSVQGYLPGPTGPELDVQAVADFSALLEKGWDDFLVMSLIGAHRFLRSKLFRTGDYLLGFALMPQDRFPGTN